MTYLGMQLWPLVLIVLAAHGFGGAIVGRAAFGPLQRLGLSVLLGLGVIAQGALGLGLVGWLRPDVVLVGLLVGAALNALPRVRTRGLGSAEVRATLVVVALGLLPAAVLCLYPPLGFDATLYHLAKAREFAAAGAVFSTLDLRYPVFPQDTEMLFAVALLFAGAPSAQLVTLAFSGATALLLAGLGSELRSPPAGRLAAALWLGTPIVVWLSSQAYVDVPLGAHTAAAIACTLKVLQRERGAALLAGLACGFAIGTKYTGFFVGWLCFIAVLAMARRGSLRDVYAFALAAAAAGGAWLLLSVRATGDPIFPFGRPVFGGTPWSDDDYARQMADLRAANLSWGDPLALVHRIWWSWGTRGGPAPWNPLLLFAAPFAVLAAFRRGGRWLGCSTLALFAAWLATIQDLRYLTTALPGAVLLGAVGVMPRALSARRSRWVGWLCLLALLPGYYAGVRSLDRIGVPPPVTPAARDALLTREYPTWPAYRWLDRQPPGARRLYALFDERMTYFAPEPSVGDWFGRGRFQDATSKKSSRELYRYLRGLGVDYLLWTWHRFKAELPRDGDFAQLFEPCVDGPQFALYRLR